MFRITTHEPDNDSNLGLVSVILRTTGERPEYLKECLYSLVTQTHKNLDVMVICDSNNEGLINCTKEGLKHFDHLLSYRFFNIFSNGKRAVPLNYGLKRVKGEYICFLDDDDIFFPDHLSLLVFELSKNDEIGCCYSGVQKAHQFWQGNHYKTKMIAISHNYPFSICRLQYQSFIPNNAFLFRSDLLKNKDLCFDENLNYFEDWDFLIKLSTLTKFKHIPKITAEIRTRDDQSNATTRDKDGWESAQEYIKRKWMDQTIRLSCGELAQIYRKIDKLEKEIDKLEKENNDLELKIKSLEIENNRLQTTLNSITVRYALHIGTLLTKYLPGIKNLVKKFLVVYYKKE